MWILAQPAPAVRQQAILFLPQAKRPIDKPCQTCYTNSRYAAMAELADALVLGSSVQDVQVQVLLAALYNLTSERMFWRLFYCLTTQPATFFSCKKRAWTMFFSIVQAHLTLYRGLRFRFKCISGMATLS